MPCFLICRRAWGCPVSARRPHDVRRAAWLHRGHSRLRVLRHLRSLFAAHNLSRLLAARERSPTLGVYFSSGEISACCSRALPDRFLPRRHLSGRDEDRGGLVSARPRQRARLPGRRARARHRISAPADPAGSARRCPGMSVIAERVSARCRAAAGSSCPRLCRTAPTSWRAPGSIRARWPSSSARRPFALRPSATSATCGSSMRSGRSCRPLLAAYAARGGRAGPQYHPAGRFCVIAAGAVGCARRRLPFASAWQRARRVRAASPASGLCCLASPLVFLRRRRRCSSRSCCSGASSWSAIRRSSRR